MIITSSYFMNDCTVLNTKVKKFIQGMNELDLKDRKYELFMDESFAVRTIWAV